MLRHLTKARPRKVFVFFLTLWSTLTCGPMISELVVHHHAVFSADKGRNVPASRLHLFLGGSGDLETICGNSISIPVPGQLKFSKGFVSVPCITQVLAYLCIPRSKELYSSVG